MKLKSLLVLLLAGIWGIGSWWWYTCKIKGFCGAERTTAQVAAAGTTAAGTALAAKSGETTGATSTDTDGDGLSDTQEAQMGLDPTKKDTDGDGIPDGVEMAKSLTQDTDGDGKIDALDDDDDGDGVLTKDENPTPNGDGSVANAEDKNGNGIPDYLDPTAKELLQAGPVTNSSTKTAGKTGTGDATDANKVALNEPNADKTAPTAKNGTATTPDSSNPTKADAEQAAKTDADKAISGQNQAKTDTTKGTDASQMSADKAKAETEKAEADDAQATADKAKANAEKAADDAQATADKAKADAEKAATSAQATADKAKADAEKAKEEATKITIETSAAANSDDIGPATLHFPTGSASPALSAETKAYFTKVVQFLKDNKSAKVTIVGHTDNKGNPTKNKVLGLKRAEMLQKTLVNLGAPKSSVSASSAGDTQPIADNSTEEGRKKNRRVEITPIK